MYHTHNKQALLEYSGVVESSLIRECPLRRGTYDSSFPTSWLVDFAFHEPFIFGSAVHYVNDRANSSGRNNPTKRKITNTFQNAIYNF